MKTTLTGYGDDFFRDELFLVEISPDAWQGRPVASYVSATGEFTLGEPLISAPANASKIAVQATHIHNITEIQAGLATSAEVATAQADITAVKSKTDSLTFTVSGEVDANAKSMNNAAITGTGTDVDPWT